MSIILLSSVELYSQSRQIVKIVDKGGYDYIPLEHLTDTTLGIICYPRLFEDFDRKYVEIFWGSYCIDGRYYLTITPEQIYLTSGHENPNPSDLYWILTIDSLVYQQILTGFQKEQKQYYYFDEFYDEGKLLNEDYSNCDFLLEKQVEKFFAYMNMFVESEEQKLDKTKRIIPQTRIYFGNSRKQIEDWSSFLIRSKK
jgi:hypothetical protein